MIDINRDTEDVEQSPFQPEIILDNYFPCAGRAEVLSRMHQALQNGASLMALTGDEGSGKTMLCRMLAHETLYHTVFFPHTVDSFDEIVRDIAVSLGLGQEINSDSAGLDESLQHIADFLLTESSELLVIFDQAENIFLATLDRIRRMLERIAGAGAQVHILLSGRTTLLENCDQISFGDFRHPDAYLFELAPLSEAETTYYLQFCAARLPDIDAAQVFTDEVVDDIYRRAQGNFRMTNILGEEAVQPHREDTSFMVLLEGVEGRVDTRKEKSVVMEYLHLDGRITRYLPWIGGAVCCLLVIFFLFRPDGEKSEVGKEVIESPQTDPTVKVTNSQQTSANLSETKELEALAPVEDSEPPEEEEAPLAVADQSGAGQASVTALPPVEQEVQPVGDEMQSLDDQAAPKTVETTETVATAQGSERARVETKKPEASQVVPENLSPPAITQQVKNIPRLRSGNQVKKKARLPVAQQSPPPTVEKAVVASPNPAADRLYQARLLAGSSWKGSAKKNMFTVQLMALNSKNGERNLKNMLAQLNYRQEAGNFYILEKKTAPEKVFVFYGEYPSLDLARLVQNSLPQFLRDHKPYALSINEAVARAGR